MSIQTIPVSTAGVAATELPQRAVVLPFPQPATSGETRVSPPAANAEDARALDSAVTSLNRYLAERRTDLSFRIDRDTDTIVVSIVDSQTGTVLRQMPSDEALRIAREIERARDGAALLHQQA